MRFVNHDGPLINPVAIITAVFTAVFICVLSFSVKADPFQNSTGLAGQEISEEITSCRGEAMTLSECAATYCDPVYSNISPCSTSITDKTFNEDGSGGRAKIRVTGTFGSNSNYSKSYSHYFTIKTAYSCPPEGENRSTHTFSKSGTNLCYDPEELAENDTCEELTRTNSHMSTQSSLSCVARSDGSMCSVTRGGSMESASGATTYFYHTDNSAPSAACYGTEATENGISGNQNETPVEKDEQTACVGPFCPANPDEHCTNGVCPSTCGTINGQFYCAAETIEQNEGRNPIDEPITPVTVAPEDEPNPYQFDPTGYDQGNINVGLAQEFARVQGLLSQIANNTKNGSGTSTGSGSSGSDMSGVESGLEEIKESFNVTSSGKGNLGTEEEWQSEVDAKQQLLDEKIAEVKDSFSNLFSLPESTGSFTGCFTITEFGGVQKACVDDYQDELKILSFVILFIFALVSISILVR